MKFWEGFEGENGRRTEVFKESSQTGPLGTFLAKWTRVSLKRASVYVGIIEDIHVMDNLNHSQAHDYGCGGSVWCHPQGSGGSFSRTSCQVGY